MDIFGDESRFFDALDHIQEEPDLISETMRDWEYDVWIRPPQSVGERRRKFDRLMGLDLNMSKSESIERVFETSGAVLRTSGIEDEFSSSRSSASSWTTDDLYLSGEVELISNDRNCSSPRECDEREVENHPLGRIQVVSSTNGEFENCDTGRRRENEFNCDTPRAAARLKARLLSKLRSVTCMTSRKVKDDNVGLEENIQGRRNQRIAVRQFKKKSKELSALFTGQDIQAHEGSILTMKFSLDGQYLASAGEDKVVRIWQVVEEERSDTCDIPEVDPSCVYFSVNQLSELGPLAVEKDDVYKSRSLKKTPDSACIVFPPKVFRILEKPLHEFQGHDGEILDLSWSKDYRLLSSSVDKTVRLWRVGVEQCLKVFSHSDYVTCVQFNPVSDDYFITGSIDGKVRIWTIGGCQVVDWSETKDIITAVSYRPDGKGGIIGSINGTCRFFNLSDDHMQLETRMCLAGKKKSPCRRITGFQFLPQDTSKVLVTCADSQVRILDGANVVGKYKGLRSTGNQISASLTSDGKHIVSASEDSNVYIWNYNGDDDSSFSHPKVHKSFECFSSDASVAIPWSGLKSRTVHGNSNNPLPFSSSSCFSLTQEYLDSNCKGSATWPEEKLPASSPWGRTFLMGKSQYKLFKTSCKSSSNSHAWGLVIVTASWDGRIRSFHNYGLPVPL